MNRFAILLFFLAPAFAGSAVSFPRPEMLDPAAKYGCKVDEITDYRTVDARNVNLPPHRWDVKVWMGSNWSVWLPKHYLNRQAALKSCDQWMRAIEKELRQEIRAR
jgi:hypothetical protein